MSNKSAKVLKYEAVFEEQEVGGYTVTVPVLPGCITEGDTFEEAKKNIAEAITGYLESLSMDGEEIPTNNSVFMGQILVPNPSLNSAAV